MKRTWIDHSCILNTDIETASTLLRNLDGWPEFTPGLEAIARNVAEPLEIGTRFRMRLRMVGAPRMTLPSQIFEWGARRFEWGGGAAGSVIRHSMELRETGPTTCELRHVEYVTNWLSLMCLPWEGVIYRHDRRWSDAIETRFR